MDLTDLDLFQEMTDETVVYRDSIDRFLDRPREEQAEWLNLNAAVLGLAGEIGEVVELVKKQMRNYMGEMTPEFQGVLRDEVGDITYYLIRVCEEGGFDLSEALLHNQTKLKNRKARGELRFHG